MVRGRSAVAIVDIDGLRHVNDRCSETIGDMVLREVAAVLAVVSGGGTAFRYGGEEFAMLFPGRSSGEVLLTMEHLRKRVEQTSVPVPAHNHGSRRHSSSRGEAPMTVSVTVGIGIADTVAHPCTPSEVIRTTYRALALAELDGGNRVTRSTLEPQSRRIPAASRRCS